MEIRIYNSLPEEALDLRITVFVDEQGFVDEVDETDSIATHIVLFNESGNAIATCRIFESDQPGTYILGRLCVLKEYRGKHIGSRMLAEAEKLITQKDGKRLILHSQSHAKEFYRKSGYSQYGDLEYEQGQPHIWMEKEIQ